MEIQVVVQFAKFIVWDKENVRIGMITMAKRFVFLLLILFLGAYKSAHSIDQSRTFPLQGFCITSVDMVELLEEGPDFILLNITVSNVVIKTYVGNHPRVDSAVSEIQTGPFILIQNDNVYKRLEHLFPTFIHFMDIKDLSILSDLALIDILKDC